MGSRHAGRKLKNMKNGWTRYEGKHYVKSKKKYTHNNKENEKVADLLDFEVSIENGEMDLRKMIIADDIDKIISILPKETQNFMAKYQFDGKSYKYNKFKDKNLRVIFIINGIKKVVILIDVVNHKMMENNNYINHILPRIIEKTIEEYLRKH